jgi:excisionase family DNA binding protein
MTSAKGEAGDEGQAGRPPRLSLTPLASRHLDESSESGAQFPTASESAAELGPERLLTADEVAAILGVPRTLVYSLVRSGEMPAVRVGERYVRFRSAALVRWIESRESSEPRRRR